MFSVCQVKWVIFAWKEKNVNSFSYSDESAPIKKAEENEIPYWQIKLLEWLGHLAL